jgi:DNA-binding response OmpR family regulator
MRSPMGGDDARDGATAAAESASETADSNPQAEVGIGPAVLIVDDDPVVRSDIARALTRAGFGVATAGSGRQALRLVADGQVMPAILVTDIELAGMTGVELAARLLAVRPAVRVVMMTGDPNRAASARRHPSIVDRVLDKPMALDELVATVRAVAAIVPRP